MAAGSLAKITYMNVDKCSFQYNSAPSGTGIIITVISSFLSFYLITGGVFQLQGGIYDSSFTNSYYGSNTAGNFQYNT